MTNKPLLATLAALMVSSASSSAAIQQSEMCGNCNHGSKPAAPAQKAQATLINGIQMATITIDGGYKPSVVSVKVGKPVELTFFRKGTGGCTEVLVIKALKFKREIKTGEKAVVKFTPTKTGEIGFECGMAMAKGNIVVTKA